MRKCGKMKFEVNGFSIEIDASTFYVTQLALDGNSFMACPRQEPIVSFVALNKANERYVLTPAKCREEGAVLVAEQLLCNGESIDIRIILKADIQDGAVSFCVRVENNASEYDIIESVFSLPGLTFGEDENTALLYPHHAGEKILNPAHRLRSKDYQEFWRAGTRLVDGEWVRECNYCGLCSMSFMFLQNSSAGLYVASQDARFPVTGLLVKTGGEEERYLTLGTRIHKRVTVGESWLSGDFVISLSHGDWHHGAKRYRRWIMPHLAPHHDPQFLANQAALNQCYNFKRVLDIQNRFENIPEMFDAGNKFGINHMFIASWNRTGFDSYYPEYYPDMELGTALDFKRGLEYVRSKGGFATLYVNARLSDMYSDFHKCFLSKMQIENERGEARTETYEPHTFTLNCPSDRQWQHMLVDICDFAVQAYGAKGIYLDQLASAEPFACFHPGHTHHDIGEFNQGYLKILDELLGRLRARDEDAYLMTENCGDIYAPYIWANLTWNGAEYDEFYNLFRYTFPEFVQVNMCNDRSWATNAQDKERFFYSDIERCVLMGNILWIGITSRYKEKPETQEHFDYVIRAADFRKVIADQVTRGTYLDDEYVDTLTGSLAASCFKVADAEALLLVGDCELSGGSAVFRLPFAVKYAEAADEYGRSIPVDSAENLVKLTLNGCRLARITVRG